ncbi:PEP-utilizing enzyme [Metabacillus malikii]|uniref:Pyruvate,water dikinase n=1 Tax=Metabacillus malikii TaxID=1504265 RepID=A0ABT9ZLK3_9BACI|nr:PEP-utilizing enzyme [Metabacillus malikii]MDQ0232875.1 pyruvate,water dikinase [Metabacillus malikii]
MTNTLIEQDFLLSKEDMDSAFWIQDDVHFPKPLSPLFTSLIMPAMGHGTKVCYERMKMQIKRVDVKSLNGYYYQSIVPADKEEYDPEEHKSLMLKLIPNVSSKLDEYVESVFKPFYTKLSSFQTTDTSIPMILEAVNELEQFFFKAWEIHYEVLTPKQAAGWILEEMYAQLVQAEDKSVLYDVLSGPMNKTLETDKAIWELSRKVKHSKELTHLFEVTEIESLPEQLSRLEAGQGFLASLQQVMNECGYRSANFHDFMEETWVENPVYILGIVKTYMDINFDFNKKLQERSTKRSQLYNELLSKIPDSPKKQEFIQMMDTALKIWHIEEDHHFYIDAMLPAKSRFFFLEVGRYLVEKQILSDQHDIFYMYLNDLKTLLAQPDEDVKVLIEKRKKEHQKNMKSIPVPFVGDLSKLGNAMELEKIVGFPQEPINKLEKSFKGAAASKGMYKGKVKLIHSQEEFHLVNHGDVLVSKTNTPAWTVLFPIVGAIITDSGGVLSHAGIVAREYGVPAVLGTKVATSTLKTGDEVIVDGTNGVIYFNR